MHKRKPSESLKFNPNPTKDGLYIVTWTDCEGKQRMKSLGNNITNAVKKFGIFEYNWLHDSCVRTPSLKTKQFSIESAWGLFDIHAKVYYRNSKKQLTTGYYNIKRAYAKLIDEFGQEPIVNFSPKKLKIMQTILVADGLCIISVNKDCSMIKLVFRWLASEEYIDESIYGALTTVKGVSRRTEGARVSIPVKPIAKEHIFSTCEHLPEVLKAMVMFQYYTGCRPAEVCSIRLREINMSDTVWVYKPTYH